MADDGGAAEAEHWAAVSLGFLAASFVTLPETWPVFHAWVTQQGPYIEAGPQALWPLVEHLRRISQRRP